MKRDRERGREGKKAPPQEIIFSSFANYSNIIVVFVIFPFGSSGSVAYNEANKMCRTISHATDKRNAHIYHFTMLFMLLSFASTFFFLTDTDMTIILWTKCNYCPPTKFLIYDQILESFKRVFNLLWCSGAHELYKWNLIMVKCHPEHYFYPKKNVHNSFWQQFKSQKLSISV